MDKEIEKRLKKVEKNITVLQKSIRRINAILNFQKKGFVTEKQVIKILNKILP